MSESAYLLPQQQMPHNQDAERSVLGAIMQDSTAMMAAAETLTAEDFFTPAHQTIYAAALELNRVAMAVDLVTMDAELSKTGNLTGVGGVEYLAYLASTIPTTANVRQYIDIVQDKALLRRLIRASGEIMDMGYSPGAASKNIAEDRKSVV